MKTQVVAEDISLLKAEINKWKYQDNLCGEGMITMPTHMKVIKKIREKWAEEMTFQRFHWEELQTELKELRKFKTMK